MTRDMQGLDALEPSSVRDYLRSRGWQRTGEVLPGVHEYYFEPANVRIDVPAPQYVDFRRRMAEVVEALAEIHQVDLSTLLDDLTTPSGDVVELRFDGQSTRDGTLPLEDAARLRVAQKDLVLAAAHSVIQPRAHFPRMSLKQATDLLQRCREGQTARGSYRTRIIIPVGPQVEQMDLDLEPPYERRVTQMLMGAVGQAARAVDEDRFPDLLTRHAQGVSVNLLQSLAALTPPGGGTLELGVRWSRSRRAPPLVVPVRLAPTAFEWFGQAARELRARTPEAAHHLVGYVVRLARAHGEDTGAVIVLEEAEDEAPRKVQVRLTGEAYQQAVEAHRSGQRLSVVGSLRRSGRVYELEEPLAPTLVPAEEPGDGAG